MSPSPFRTIVYVSSATGLWTPEQLDAILTVSRQRNQAAEVTGLLLYCDGNIMQCLEGPAQAVQHTFDRVERDPRHRGLIVLFDEPVAHRDFAAWSMACSRVSGPDFAALRGAPWPGNRGGPVSLAGTAPSLLASFWNNMHR